MHIDYIYSYSNKVYLYVIFEHREILYFVGVGKSGNSPGRVGCGGARIEPFGTYTHNTHTRRARIGAGGARACRVRYLSALIKM